MASDRKAIFTAEFHYQAKGRNIGWSASASDKPQTFPREFIEAAIKAGRAHKIPAKRVNKADQSAQD